MQHIEFIFLSHCPYYPDPILTHQVYLSNIILASPWKMLSCAFPNISTFSSGAAAAAVFVVGFRSHLFDWPLHHASAIFEIDAFGIIERKQSIDTISFIHIPFATNNSINIVHTHARTLAPAHAQTPNKCI